MEQRAWRTLITIAWLSALAGVLGLLWVAIERKITWYLAVDQFGYLTFARDLLRGHILHDWPPLAAFAERLPTRVDVLAQTYVYDHGKLYCRYAPGFPIVLAAWMALFGENGAHYLNSTIYLLLLLLVGGLARRLLGGRAAATAALLMVILFPTLLHLWAITLTRDLAAHLFGLFGLFLLLPAGERRLRRRLWLAAGLSLGYAVSIRPDACLYLVPASGIVLARLHAGPWRRGWFAGAVLAGIVGVLVGTTPLLAYNWFVMGNPLAPTQGMELEWFLGTTPSPGPAPPPTQPPHDDSGVAYPSGAWHGTTSRAVAGGGLMLKNLRTILPQNLQLLREDYGDKLYLTAIVGMLVSLLNRRLLFLTTVPYIALALPLYSCWSRSDPRYLSGVFLLMPLLILEGSVGTLALLATAAARGWRRLSVILALLVALAAFGGSLHLFALRGLAQTRLDWIQQLVLLTTGGGALVAAWRPRPGIARVGGIVVALGLLASTGWLLAFGSQNRARFQRPQMEEARVTFMRAVQAPAVVITTEDIGRPAENIEHYTGIHALYLTDLERWHTHIFTAAILLARGGFTPYLLLPAANRKLPEIVRGLEMLFSVELIAQIPSEAALQYFVGSILHRGVPLRLYRLTKHPDW